MHVTRTHLRCHRTRSGFRRLWSTPGGELGIAGAGGDSAACETVAALPALMLNEPMLPPFRSIYQTIDGSIDRASRRDISPARDTYIKFQLNRSAAPPAAANRCSAQGRKGLRVGGRIGSRVGGRLIAGESTSVISSAGCVVLRLGAVSRLEDKLVVARFGLNGSSVRGTTGRAM